MLGVSGAERFHRPTVKSSEKADNQVSSRTILVERSFSGQFDRRFGCFGTAITEKDPVEGCQGRQSFGKDRLDIAVVPVGYMDQAAGLINDGSGDPGVTMPQVAGRYAGYEIDIFVSVRITQPVSY